MWLQLRLTKRFIQTTSSNLFCCSWYTYILSVENWENEVECKVESPVMIAITSLNKFGLVLWLFQQHSTQFWQHAVCRSWGKMISTVVAVMCSSVYVCCSQKGSARNACKAVFVDITFNFSLSRLQMRGFKDNLGKIPTHQIIKDAEASVNQRQNAMMVLQQVGFTCMLGTFM